MSAPVTERPRGAVRTAPRPGRTSAPAAIPAPRRASRTEQAGQAGSGSAKRAYARRDERLRRLVGGALPATRSGAAPTRRAQFVMLVMALLGTGLVLTLWLSTAAAADSYRLQDARDATGALTEQAEALRREVAVADSATELARRAGQLGMVPVRDSARLVVDRDGAVTVVGEPVVARVPAPVAPPAAPVAPPAQPSAPDPAAADPAVPAVPAVPDPADPAGPDPAGPDPVGVDPSELAAADPAAAAAVAAAGPDGATPAAN